MGLRHELRISTASTRSLNSLYILSRVSPQTTIQLQMPLTHPLRAETRHISPFVRFNNQQLVVKHLHMRACRNPSNLIIHRFPHLSSSRRPRPSFQILFPLSAMCATSTLLQPRVQVRAHAGHSHGHGHGHSHDNTYLTSSNRNDAGVRITRIGLFVNLGMAIGKGVGGYMFHSQALIADGFHALTDLVSDFMTLATISWSLKPATDRFPSGFGKIESLGALGVSGLLLFGGMGIGLNGLDALYTQIFLDTVEHAHDHAEHSHGLFSFLGHSHSHGVLPDLNAAWLAAGSIVIKEWLYRSSKFTSTWKRWHVTLTIRSHQNRSRTKILCSSLQCCSPPDRFPDQYCCTCYYRWCPRFCRCILAGPGWWTTHLCDGCQSRLEQYSHGLTRTRRYNRGR